MTTAAVRVEWVPLAYPNPLRAPCAAWSGEGTGLAPSRGGPDDRNRLRGRGRRDLRAAVADGGPRAVVGRRPAPPRRPSGWRNRASSGPSPDWPEDPRYSGETWTLAPEELPRGGLVRIVIQPPLDHAAKGACGSPAGPRRGPVSQRPNLQLPLHERNCGANAVRLQRNRGNKPRGSLNPEPCEQDHEHYRPPRIYADRTAGRHHDHWHLDGPDDSGGAGDAGSGPPPHLHQSPQPHRAGPAKLRVGPGGAPARHRRAQGTDPQRRQGQSHQLAGAVAPLHRRDEHLQARRLRRRGIQREERPGADAAHRTVGLSLAACPPSHAIGTSNYAGCYNSVERRSTPTTTASSSSTATSAPPT